MVNNILQLALMLLIACYVSGAQHQINFNGAKPSVKPPRRHSASSAEAQIATILTRSGGNVRPRNEGDQCTIPDGGGLGKCSSWRSCSAVVSFVRQNRQNSRGVLNFVRQRLCRADSNSRSVIVCCEVNNPVTPKPPVRQTGGPSVELPTRCGEVNGVKVTNGDEIRAGSEPWLVAVGTPNRRTGRFQQTCGGTLITRKHVISASHCFHDVTVVPTTIVAGEHDLSRDDTRVQTRKIANHINPGYNRGFTLENDLELLRLETDIIFEPNLIQPVCLPNVLPRNIDYKGKFLSVVGWGITEDKTRSNVPKRAEVAVVDQATCRAQYPPSKGVDINSKKICAGDNGKDACQGDSGGPLLYTDTTDHFRIFLAGVVSFGTGCGLDQFSGVYTNVASYVDWITDNL